MLRRILPICWLLTHLFAGPAGAADGWLHEQASGDALRATVFGPDPDTMAPLPERVPVRELNLRIDGSVPVPDLFWFNRRLRVWYSGQRHDAPLVVLIAGTGGDGNTRNIQVLRRALYGAGYHVLTIPSPTFPGFIVSASTTGVAGDLQQDSADLRRVLRQVLPRLPARGRIEDLHIVGYSLGGAHAAMLKALDEGDDALDIGRVVMINPPVDLFASVARIDRMFAEAIGPDGEAIERFYQRLYAELADLYQEAEVTVIDASFLLDAASRVLRSDREFAAAIALAFRLALLDLFFAGDYYAGSGFVVDPDRPPRPGDPLDEALLTLRAQPFAEYFDRVFAPYWLDRRPGITREMLITQNSLRSIEHSLREDAALFAQHNADDFILDAGELDWLRRTLGERIRIYDGGGHLGNIGERSQIEDLLDMLDGRWPRGDADQP